jgi:hypothetical protein
MHPTGSEDLNLWSSAPKSGKLEVMKNDGEQQSSTLLAYPGITQELPYSSQRVIPTLLRRQNADRHAHHHPEIKR